MEALARSFDLSSLDQDSTLRQPPTTTPDPNDRTPQTSGFPIHRTSSHQGRGNLSPSYLSPSFPASPLRPPPLLSQLSDWSKDLPSTPGGSQGSPRRGEPASGYASDVSTNSLPNSKDTFSPSSASSYGMSPPTISSGRSGRSNILSPDKVNGELPPIPAGERSPPSSRRYFQPMQPEPLMRGESNEAFGRHLRAPSAGSYLLGRASPDVGHGYASSNGGFSGQASPQLGYSCSSATQTSEDSESESFSEGEDEMTRDAGELPRSTSIPFDLDPDLSLASQPAKPTLKRSNTKTMATRHLSLKRAGSTMRRRQSRSGRGSPVPDDSVVAASELLPDASHANRRPPEYDPPCMTSARASFQAFAVCAGTIVTASGNKVKIYRTAAAGGVCDDGSAEKVAVIGEGKDKEGSNNSGAKITALAFRPIQSLRDLGRYVWVGTAAGNIWELDTIEEKVTGCRSILHSEPIVKMVRVGSGMFCLDESGKTSVWLPRKNEEGILQPISIESHPFTQRIQYDHKCVPIIVRDQLWIGSGSSDLKHSAERREKKDSHSPRVSVYNPFAEDKPFNALSRPSYIPTGIAEGVGSITCGAVVPDLPDLVFIGHSSGHVSIWSREKYDCKSVVMCTRHGITALAGVTQYLWAANKSGRIVVYDPSETPFRVQKMWPAHRDPVLGLMVDTYSIATQRLQVASGSLDGQVKVWDGLLAEDWKERELTRRVSEFCTYRKLKTLQLTWNLDAAEPGDLTGSSQNADFLSQVITSANRPDVIVFGLQELIDLEDKRLAAKSLLLGKRKVGNELGDRISSQYRDWLDKLIDTVNQVAQSTDETYVMVHSELLVGLMSCTFVRAKEAASLRDVSTGKIKTGIMSGLYGNKGAILARMVIDDTSVCFVNCHLAAGQRRIRQRNEQVVSIVEKEEALPAGEHQGNGMMAYVCGGDGR